MEFVSKEKNIRVYDKSGHRDINVGCCVVELSPFKQNKENVYVSSPFIFQKSECHARIFYGWDTNSDRKIKFSLIDEPALAPNFFATLSIFKGSQVISYPTKLIKENIKYMWSLSVKDIAKQLPGIEIWNLKFKLYLQQDAESNYALQNFDKEDSGHEVVQTSLYRNENRSMEKLSEDIETLLEGETNSDIELKSGGIVVKVHKAVLRARSKFFERMLQSVTENQIELQYMDRAAFNEIIRYMYSGKSPDLSYELAKNIYKAGEMCDTGYLKELCEQFLIDNLKVDNACECLALAVDDYSFKEKVINFIFDKDIPFFDQYWKPFCNNHRELAIDVLNKLVRSLWEELRERRKT